MLVVEDLTKQFQRTRGILSGEKKEVVRAVDHVSFSVNEGETLGLVGESGCGKTTLGRLIVRLIEPTGGSILYNGKNILALKNNEMRELRRELQIIFQDPYSSLNPRMTIGSILEEPLLVQRMGSAQRKDRISELLEWVGMTAECLRKYPHEFSGGQRQRIGIARALSLTPRLIVADEPVSALDVSIQAQIINLLLELQERLRLSFVFISHDISVIKHVSHRIAVMYLGRIVEMGPAAIICENPAHPYTKLLLLAVPDISDDRDSPETLPSGDIPNPISPPPGCHFHPRCPVSDERCRESPHEMREIGTGHLVACRNFKL
jgi:oligopeptide transport system ATP-binding protein